MPTYSCHFSDDLSPAVDLAIKQSVEGKEGQFVKNSILQRMTREGSLPNTPRSLVRDVALETAEVVGEEKVLQVLTEIKREALAGRAAKVG